MFASEAKALLAVPGRRSAARSRLRWRNTSRWATSPRPIRSSRACASSSPATALIAEGGQVRKHRYYRLPAAIDAQPQEQQWIERRPRRARARRCATRW